MIMEAIKSTRTIIVLQLLLCAGFVAPLAAAEDAEAPTPKDVGEQRFQVGEITVDRVGKSFTVPGKILHLDEPLEYLAVSANGMKGYESLLELSASAREFNLACILIGFDEKYSVKPRYQFDEQEPKGQAVEIRVSWEVDGETLQVSGANAMTIGDKKFNDDNWVYIGSATSEDGQQFMADIGGTLIGFVHDPYSVIDHVTGGGIGDYGLITGNNAVLPPEGSEITLSVALVQK